MNKSFPKETQKCISQFSVQSDFRKLYPEKAKAIQGMTVPSSCASSVQDMVRFANEKINNKKVKIEHEKLERQKVGAPSKFSKDGRLKI
jgi:hypothetical protein